MGAVRVVHIKVVSHRQVRGNEKVPDGARTVGPQQFRNRGHPSVFCDDVTDPPIRLLALRFAHTLQVIDGEIA
jgi:hypothetical protein